MRFRDRSDAGRRLASRLQFLRSEDVVVLGLPRGGVPVAVEVARTLAAPLDVILVRKLGVPAQPELGLGAIGESGARVINQEVVHYAHVSEAQIAQVEQKERAELQRRAQRFRGDVPHEPLAGRTAVIVDDGIATGSTARAACQVARALGAATVVLAVPVAPPSADRTLRGDADEVICLEMPERFQAIGEWYEDWPRPRTKRLSRCCGRRGPGSRTTGRRSRCASASRMRPGNRCLTRRRPVKRNPDRAGGVRNGESRGELDGLVAMMPFAAGLGVVLDAAAPGEVRGRMAWAAERCTSGGILHGGVLMALADSLGGICAFLNLEPGALTATTSSATVFTRAVRSGEVTAVTRPLHVGRTMIVVQTDLTDEAGRRVAQVTQTQAVLAGRG